MSKPSSNPSGYPFSNPSGNPRESLKQSKQKSINILESKAWIASLGLLDGLPEGFPLGLVEGFPLGWLDELLDGF